jgi:O-antigen ligase
LVSAFNSIAPPQSWFFLDVLYKELLMALLLTRLVQSPDALKVAVVLIVTGVGFNAFEINTDYFSTGYSLVNRDGWALQNANGYALILTLAACLSIAAALHVTRWYWRAVLLVVALIDVHAIYIVEARGAMLGMIAAGVCFAYLVKKNARNVTLGLAAVVCAMALAGPSVVKEFMSSFEENLDASAEDRFYVWHAGMLITRDYPVFGVGPWAAEYLVPQYYDGDARSRPSIHLHNLPLEIFTGSGVPALLGYCAFFLLPIRSAFKVIRRDHAATGDAVRLMIIGAIAGMAGYWLGSMFNSGALLELPYIFIALVLAALAIEERTAASASATPATEQAVVS